MALALVETKRTAMLAVKAAAKVPVMGGLASWTGMGSRRLHAGRGTVHALRRGGLHAETRAAAAGRDRLWSAGPGTARAFHGTGRALSGHRDYYEVLGVDRGADEKQIKKRYRELAKMYHPDQCKDEDATEKFQEISHAYEVLSDPEKRQAYDSFGPDFEQAMGGGGGPDMGGFEDFFSGFGGFGGGGRAPRNAGEDAQIRLDLSFMEAVKGCTKTVDFKVAGPCGTCGGSGAKQGEKPKTKVCNVCQGQGVRLKSVGGIFQVPTACAACEGTGRKITNKCGTCAGTGQELQDEKVTLNVPPGVDSGMTISQRGMGHAGRQGGPRGDLLVGISVGRDPYFKREGTDLHTSVQVSLSQAVLGDKVPVRTLDGDVDLKIPPGVRHGEVRRLRGRGVEQIQRSGARGDQYVTFEVRMPSSLTDRQRELMKEFEEEERAKAKTK